MFELLINGKQIQLLQPVAEVMSISIKHIAGFPIPIQQGARQKVADWLYDVTQKCTGIITYQGIIIEKDSVNKL